ncbi:MAG: DUF2304 domain-containing protein [Lachnospiraceae bacterium]
MSGVLRVLMILGAVFLMAFMLKRIRYAKMKIEYTVFWIMFSGILVLMGIFPQLFYWISKLLGFQAPINMIYLVIIFVLIVKLFLTSIQISQLENKVDSLTQQVAIDRKADKDNKDV